ncbi:hypothetical protein ABZ260_14345 [Streptosporangium sp. NPDC006013]|uniref:hypothetical protein n=1 Tax=Streptosporangium sp. NPDC006013 TaxID=3155596 RepID=UPI00339FE78E
MEPGTYEIVNAKGHCLRGAGGFNSKALIGACDTRWKVARSAERDGFVITHTTTANRLARALELIYPPRAATLPCDLARTPPWTFTDAGENRVTISIGGSVHLTDPGGDRRTVVLLAPGVDGQQWTLRRG